MKACASCGYWKATEIYIYRGDMHPHEQRAIDVDEEMARATHALCTWPTVISDVLATAPDWLRKQVGGGTLTSEDDGAGCPAWTARPGVKIGSAP